jgi:peptide/nickel transport system permease protein
VTGTEAGGAGASPGDPSGASSHAFPDEAPAPERPAGPGMRRVARRQGTPRWIAGRVLGALLTVWGVATLVFFLMHLSPGDPASLYLSPNVSAEALEQMRRNMGLDRPVHVQYLSWLGAMATGEFGHSHSRGQPVADVIRQILPNTLLLAGVSLVLAFAVGVGVGIVQAVRRNGWVDGGLSVVTLFFHSMPSFWLALMLIALFSLGARNAWDWPIWFPASGMVSVDHAFLSPGEQVMDRIRHLVLPATALALVLAGGIARYTRSAFVEVLGADFIRTARAKGVPEGQILVRHALRNALLPLVTLAGLFLPLLFSGAVFVEAVFAWPGMGKMVVDAVAARDYPVVMAGTFVFALLVVAGNLLADLLYRVVDPRIRLGGGAG